jgi:hypothetical protein
MELAGTILEHGTTKKEKKDETEYIHHIKVAEKGNFKLSIASWDKELMAKIKQDGIFEFDPAETEITITVQCKVKKEKYDKEDENLLPNTGNPWYTFKKIVVNTEDYKEEINNLISGPHEVRFA